MDNNAIESIVQAVLKKLSESGESAEVKKADVFAAVTSFADDIPDSDLVDITSKEIKSVPLIENPADGDSLDRMIKSTPARIGVGRAGPRLKTQTPQRERSPRPWAPRRSCS